MAAYDTLRAAIDSYIKANGNKEITGTVLNDILNAMVSALGADTRFAGVAVPTTNPGNPEGNVVYFASQAGTYSNFGGIVLPLGIHILVWNGTAWTSQTWFSVDNTPTQNSQNLATSGGILQAIVDAVGVERLRAIGVEVTSCSFDSNTKKISFFNSADDTLFQLDATAFVIDGMVSDVKIEDGNLVIQFNTDAGKQDIEIPLTDIFNPDNYYTKTAIDALLALYYTKTETDALLTAINNKLADGCLYRGMAEPTTNPPTPTTKVFYIATKAGTYTNFDNIAVTEGITILKYDGSDWSKEQISYSDGVFDISAYHATGGELAKYADLSAALDSNNGGGVPQSLQKGGMSVKFVQTSDNNYQQFRLMSDSFNTTPANWQGVTESGLDFDNTDAAKRAKITTVGAILDFLLLQGYLYRGIATTITSPGIPKVKVFYFATGSGTYTNFLDSNGDALVLTQGINILKYDGTSWSSEEVWNTWKNIVFDISEYHRTDNIPATYASLTDALGENGANIPQAVRVGGMSIKYIDSTIGKYVQYRYITSSISDATIKNIANWQGIDNSITYGSNDLAKSGAVFDKVELPLRSGRIGIRSYGMNMFDKNQLAFGGKRMYINPSNGKIIYKEQYSLFISHLIPISDNVTILYIGSSNNFVNTAGYRFYNNVGEVIAYGAMPSTSSGTFNVPSGAKYFQFSSNSNNLDAIVSDVQVNSLINHKYYNEVDVQSFIDGKFIGCATKNLFNKKLCYLNGYGGYYINMNGDILLSSDTRAYTSHLIPLVVSEENITISCSALYFQSWCGYRFLDKNLKVISCGRMTNNDADNVTQKTFAIPSSAMFFQFCAATFMGDIQVEYGTEATLYEPYGKTDESIKIGNNSIRTDSAASGNTLTLNNIPDVKTDFAIGVVTNVTTMGKIGIIQNDENYRRGHIEIDTTTVYMYNWKNGTQTTVQHGLTITDLLNISIYAKPASIGKALLKMSSLDGNVFEQEISWGAAGDTIVLDVISGEYTNISLSYGGTWMKKDLWIFHDSFADMWPAYLYENNYRNFTLDSHSGRNAAGGLDSLKIGLKYGKPKTILWMHGMTYNEDGAMDQDWLNATKELMYICSREGINLILTVVPNTPIRHSTYKNAWVRASGYPYFDMAALVGGTEDDSTWFPGLLSNDNIHPTALGAKVIAEGLISYLPEIIC